MEVEGARQKKERMHHVTEQNKLCLKKRENENVHWTDRFYGDEKINNSFLYQWVEGGQSNEKGLVGKNTVINKLIPVQSAAAGLQGLGRQA